MHTIGMGEIFAREWLAVYFNIGPYARETNAARRREGGGSFAGSNVGLRGAGTGGGGAAAGAERKPSAAGAKTAAETAGSGVRQAVEEATS
jgi:hypothetical protein